MKRIPRSVLVGMAACAALTGCSASAHGPRPAAAARAEAATAPARGAADRSGAVPAARGRGARADSAGAPVSGMVSAVSAASSDRPIDLKFALLARPTLGQPLHIDLALIVAHGTRLRAIRTSLQGSGGLQVKSAPSFTVYTPMPGQVVRQRVTVLPQRAGVLRLDATVLFDRADSSVARTFAIPLIVAGDRS